MKRTSRPSLGLFSSVRWRRRLLPSCLGLIAAIGLQTAASAAERITLKVGPLSQSIYLEDLAVFARTGTVPERLQLYRSVLTPEVQQALGNRLALDPAMSQRMIDDILASPNGELLLDTLATVAPDLTVEQLQAAIRIAANQAEGLSLISILQAVPQETLEVDVTAAIALLSQLNLSRLQGQALSSVLANELLDATPTPLPRNLDPARQGVQPIEERTLIFYDRSRKRSIPVDVYWGQQTQPGPMVVLSHGFGADRRFLAYLATHLASHGVTVVSIEHPGSNVEALTQVALDPGLLEQPSRILPATEFLDRPRDVSHVLDRLTWMNQTRTAFAGRFNTAEVVLIGHSLGGYTGLALAGAQIDLSHLNQFCDELQPVGLTPADWLQCAAVELPEKQADLSDPRIIQVMAMNPLVGQLFGEAGLSQVSVPTVILTGTQDSVTPTLSQQLMPFTQLSQPKYLAVVIGGTHLSVGDPDNINQSLTQVPFMPELHGEQSIELRRFLKGMALAFVMQQTPEAERYAPFLSSAYAQQFSTEALSLRFTQTLPDSVLSWLRLIQQTPIGSQPSLTVAASWLHLEALGAKHRLGRWQQQVTAYLNQEHIAITVLQWPLPTLLL
ncbi:MAG: alpha/beta fold hydrolase [Leptolyngbya sp. SIO4C1]|nr:alpha/beta fold hydrolase [Leptolyngbya sp. SIO4C1]